ncbi:MAG: hypothetical protein J0L93_09215 [Deltaproteobacteria bacterium]|nr:hypothetical protein [Deltaproteobacteria bacterium]
MKKNAKISVAENKKSGDRLAILKQPRTWIILGCIILGAYILDWLGLEIRVIAALAVLAGILTQAFTIILGLIALVPVVGPIIVGLLSLPIFWFINATSHMITAMAVKQGYGKDIARSKLLVIMLMVGLILGFLIGYWTR